MSNSGQRQQYQVEALEPRLLLSADGLGVGADSLQNETDPLG
ncbi:MAG: LEPR-XLL domain-containing protein, partial [Verrucomicrobiaceae bacterium]|nr:LEPR-XLL domain-containing protein [Verrucomicrobiaceae bacterium]